MLQSYGSNVQLQTILEKFMYTPVGYIHDLIGRTPQLVLHFLQCTVIQGTKESSQLLSKAQLAELFWNLCAHICDAFTRTAEFCIHKLEVSDRAQVDRSAMRSKT